jgi:arginyl-tRNA synthetase
VRWKKILNEINSNEQTSLSDSVLTIFDRDLILDILGFNELLENCGESYKFHLLIAHIATMTRHLNALYVNTTKLKETPENERVARMTIIHTCLGIIESTGEIIGMPLPSEM